MKYSEFDPEKSRALLEKSGYRDTDGDGFREFKDGTRFEMNINVTSTQKNWCRCLRTCFCTLEKNWN